MNDEGSDLLMSCRVRRALGVTSARFRGRCSIRVLVFALAVLSPAVPLRGDGGGGAEASSGVEAVPCELPRYQGEARCGILRVFEDRKAGSGRTVDVRFAVLPATGDDPAPDPVAVLPGGPGQGTLDQAAQWAALFEEIRRKRDLLLVDPRGAGRSDPLVCPLPGDDDDPQSYLGPRLPPEALVACRKELEADPRFYTTPLIADDLDDLRAALGYERLNLYGTSYGTRVALVYLRRHPERVRVAALDGVVPPDMTTPLHHAPDAQRALDLLFDECESDPACNEAYPDLREKFWAVEERLAEEPVEVELTDPKTGLEITVTMTRDLFNEEIRWRLYDQEANRVPKLVHESYRGDFSGVAALLLRLRRVIAPSRTLVVGMYLSVTCTEDVPFIDPEEARRLAEGTFLGTHRVEQQRAACQVWPRGRLPEGYREPVRSSKPVLIVSGYRDPVTPPRWGEKVLQTLSAGRHVVVRQGFHFGAGGDSCVRRLLTRFIEQGSAEDLDTSCARHGPAVPFVLPDRESEDKEEE